MSDEKLEEAANQSGILAVEDDFISPEFRAECTRIIISENLKPPDYKNTFFYLKQNFNMSNVAEYQNIA